MKQKVKCSLPEFPSRLLQAQRNAKPADANDKIERQRASLTNG